MEPPPHLAHTVERFLLYTFPFGKLFIPTDSFAVIQYPILRKKDISLYYLDVDHLGSLPRCWFLPIRSSESRTFSDSQGYPQKRGVFLRVDLVEWWICPERTRRLGPGQAPGPGFYCSSTHLYGRSTIHTHVPRSRG